MLQMTLLRLSSRSTVSHS